MYFPVALSSGLQLQGMSMTGQGPSSHCSDGTTQVLGTLLHLFISEAGFRLYVLRTSSHQPHDIGQMLQYATEHVGPLVSLMGTRGPHQPSKSRAKHPDRSAQQEH